MSRNGIELADYIKRAASLAGGPYDLTRMGPSLPLGHLAFRVGRLDS